MKILVGMSGGVDSSVVAYLLKKQGHEVIGATMRTLPADFDFSNFKHGGCFSSHEEDILAAKNICEKLGITHHIIDCSKKFQEIVLTNFKKEYLSGNTPNPCVWCNSEVKFRVLPESVQELGIEFDKFATGHYARIIHNKDSNLYELRQGIITKKDQTYFLYRLEQERLAKILMPLGEYSKENVREIAKEAGLEVADKKDSQDFYNGDLNDLIQVKKKGNFVTTEGKILGHHEGIWNFTIGQRRGMGIAAEKPLYVIELRADTNEVVVGFKEEAGKSTFKIKDIVWSDNNQPDKINCMVKIRSSQRPVECELYGNEVRLFYQENAIAKGQSAVFYQDDLVLGGGIIC